MQRGSRGMNVNYLKPRFLRFRLRMLPNEERAKAFEIEHFLLSFGPVVRWGARYRRIDYGFALDGNVVFHYALSPERRKYMTRTAHPFGSENIIGFTSCSEEVMRSILGDRRMRTFWPMRGEGACILGPEDPLQVIEIEESPWAPAGVRAAPPIPPAIAPSIAPAPAPAIDPASTPASALAYPAATVNAAPAADLVAAFVAAIAAVSVAGPAALASALQSALGASAAQLASSLPTSAPALPSASAVPSAGGAPAGDAPPIDVYEIPASVKAVDGISAALSSSALSMVKQPSSSKAEANAQPPTPSASAFAAVASPGPSRTSRSQRRSVARQATAASAVGVANRPTRSRSAAASSEAIAAHEPVANNEPDSAGDLPSDATTCESPSRTPRSQRRSATLQSNAASAVGVTSRPTRSRSAAASRKAATASEPIENNQLDSAADLSSDAATCNSPGPMRTPRAQRRSAARRTQAAATAGAAGEKRVNRSQSVATTHSATASRKAAACELVVEVGRPSTRSTSTKPGSSSAQEAFRNEIMSACPVSDESAVAAGTDAGKRVTRSRSVATPRSAAVSRKAAACELVAEVAGPRSRSTSPNPGSSSDKENENMSARSASNDEAADEKGALRSRSAVTPRSETASFTGTPAPVEEPLMSEDQPAAPASVTAASEHVEEAVGADSLPIDEATCLINDAAIDAHLQSTGPSWIAEVVAKRCTHPLEVRSAAVAAADWLRVNPGLHDDYRHFKFFNVEAPHRKDDLYWQLRDIKQGIELRASKEERREAPAVETIAALIEVCCTAMRNIRDKPQKRSSYEWSDESSDFTDFPCNFDFN